MASLLNRNGSFLLTLCYLGRRHYLTLGKVSKQEAEGFAGKIDLLLLRIKQKLLALPLIGAIFRKMALPGPPAAA